MFKIESYVTPILLSYVDKYVRDFKPADAQVSLWGGGVALHNLVLKADVLQKEIALPFTLVSGRIHELLIQVPWTKIMSEPIVVTIDTIECVLSIHPPAPDDNVPPESPSRKVAAVEAPPGYMQALVRRVVSNITLRVHHLIVKYVQDDVVLSLNIKHLSVESAGSNWETSFADIEQAEPLIRRLVRLDDLTLCLDRADADGKIRFYQEPLLYRCQLDLRVMTRLMSANTRRATSLCVQLRSSKLAWGVTSEQLTLLLRLLRERSTEHARAPPPAKPQAPNSSQPPKTTVYQLNESLPVRYWGAGVRRCKAPREERAAGAFLPELRASILGDATSSNSAEPVRSESWSEWAWSWLPTWMDREGGVEEATVPSTPIPVFFAVFLDHVSLVLKVLETESGGRKRARGVLEVFAEHVAARAASCAPISLRVRFGVRAFRLVARGKCVCGNLDPEQTPNDVTVFMDKKDAGAEIQDWSWPAEILEDKVDAAEVAEEEDNLPNRGEFQIPRTNPEADQAESSEERNEDHPPPTIEIKDDNLWHVMSPIIFLEFSHMRSPPSSVNNPYDNPPIDFEFSDWGEDNSLKISVQPLQIRVTIGLLHRLSAFQASFKDLPQIPVQDIPMKTLTVEECEALYENLPQRRIDVNVYGLRIRLHPWDLIYSDTELALDLEVPLVRLGVSGPLYSHRVCSAACQMPKDDGPLWQGARLHVSCTLSPVEARLVTPSTVPTAPQAARGVAPDTTSTATLVTNPTKPLVPTLAVESDSVETTETDAPPGASPGATPDAASGTAPGSQAYPLLRFDLRLMFHVLLHPEMFARRDTVHTSYTIKIHEVVACGSAPRLWAAWLVVRSLIMHRVFAPLRYSQLAADALADQDYVSIDATAMDLSMRGFLTRHTQTHSLMLHSARVMAFYGPVENKLKQAWIFSAPDVPTSTSFLRVAGQFYSERFDDSLDYVGIWMEPISICIDPLLIAWLAYRPEIRPIFDPTTEKNASVLSMRRRSALPSSSGRGISRAGSGADMVHTVRPRSASSSEPGERLPNVYQQSSQQSWSVLQPEQLLKLYERMQRVLLTVEAGLVLVYVCTSTASAVDCASLHDVMERHAAVFSHVMAMRMGRLTLCSSDGMRNLWDEVRHDGPTFIKVGNGETMEKALRSFPWKMSIVDVSCYTVGARQIIDSGRERAFGLQSRLKNTDTVALRTILESVTTTITLSVVTKSMQIRSWSKPQGQASKTAGISADEKVFEAENVSTVIDTLSQQSEKLKYFATGADFKPGSLKDFVRGPARREKETGTQPEPKNKKHELTEVTKEGPVVSIGVNLYADTPPIVVKLDQDQVHTVAATIHCLQHLEMIIRRAPQKFPRSTCTTGSRAIARSVNEVTQDGTQSNPSFSESRSDLVPIFECYVQPEVKLKKFFWFQWVVGRATLVISSKRTKLAFEADDIISTIDLQEHYNQLKVKIGSASIRHQKKNLEDEWTTGLLGGRVLEAREPTNAKEENQFLSVTITQAQISTLPESWKEELHPKLLEHSPGVDNLWEVFATLAPLEAVLQPAVLENIMILIQEMAPPSFCPLQIETAESGSSFLWPFCYISAGGLRLLITTEASEEFVYDTFVVVVGRVSVNPHPENPICRQSITGGLEGSWPAAGGLGGRQFEITIYDFAVQSTLIDLIVEQEAIEMSRLNGAGSENPAVKWTQPPVFSVVTPILHPVNVCCVLAPATYSGETLEGGPAMELNILTDCALELSMDQLQLAVFVADHARAAASYESDISLHQDNSHGLCPYMARVIRQSQGATIDMDFSTTKLNEEEAGNLGSSHTSIADSGVDISMTKSRLVFDMPSKKYVSMAFNEESIEASDYIEVFVTMGTIELSLYIGDDGSPEIIALRPPGHKQVSQELLIKSEDTIHLKLREPVQPELKRNISDQTRSRSLTEAVRDADLGHTKLKLNTFLNCKRFKNNLPLLHISVHQPNLYYWKKSSIRSLQVSLFDAWVGLGAAPMQEYWSKVIFSTAKGEPDPVTDIPPALATATVKIVLPSNGGASILTTSCTSAKGSLNVNIERPVLLEVSTDIIQRLLHITQLFGSKFRQTMLRFDTSESIKTPLLYTIRNMMVERYLESITIQVSQLGVSGSEGTVGWDSASLQVAAGLRPDRLVARALVSALLVAAGPPGAPRHVFLQPLMIGLEMESFWEAWRRVEGGALAQEPTVRVGMDLDRVNIDARPGDLKALNRIHQEVDVILKLQRLLQPPTPPAAAAPLDRTENIYHTDLGMESYSAVSCELDGQFYKDDLKSGAFKLINGDQLPMTYQVILKANTVSWRYPQPRTVTKISVFPIPGVDEEVKCVLEFYHFLLSRWEPHTYLQLPVLEPREIKLYVTPPDAIFAVLWRFRAYADEENEEPPFEFNIQKFTPRAEPLTQVIDRKQEPAAEARGASAEELVGALRVDSYFAPRLLPRVHAVLRFTQFELHVYNSLPCLSSQASDLEGYYVSPPLLRTHRMLSMLASDATLHAMLGSSAGSLLLLDAALSCDVLESATGMLEQAAAATQLRVALSAPAHQKPRARVSCDAVHLALHVSRLRTLNALANDWIPVLKKRYHKNVTDEQRTVPSVNYSTKRALAHATAAVLDGRVSLWVHNSCSSELRVGQEGTDELVPLAPGSRLAYRWRSPNAPLNLRFALAGPNSDCQWSDGIPFTGGVYRVRLKDAELLGSTQKPGAGVFLHTLVDAGPHRKLTLAGRLVLANVLRRPLMYKVRARCAEAKAWRSVSAGELQPETVGRSVLCGADCDIVLKIKFGAQESGWSGDIPLKECPKENVPWLVKVPEKGGIAYVSVWCRVVRARVDNRLLAAIWPLYMLHSHLPLDTDVLVATQTELSTADMVADTARPAPLVQALPGRGACTHLHAPGTTAARHQLSFQYRELECPVTREAIPLHYGVTDTSVFDKRAPVDKIEEVIEDIRAWLERSRQDATSGWPYSTVKSHWNEEWGPAASQPRCDVTVRYGAVRAGGGCSLLIQLCPVVLLCNAAPMPLTLRAHDAAPLCKLHQGTAISAPSAVLKKPFFLSTEVARDTFVSNQLQVWAEEPGLYGSPPSGCVALDRSTPFAINCHQQVAFLTLYYEIKEEINILGVTSTYVLINRLNTNILASTIAVPLEINIPTMLRPKSFKLVRPTKGESLAGEPLCRFVLAGRWHSGEPCELGAFLCLALPAEEGSTPHAPTPVRLGAAPARRTLNLIYEGTSMPVVVLQQKYESRWLVTVAPDPCPQFVVHNHTGLRLAVAEVRVRNDPAASLPSALPSHVQTAEECLGAHWWYEVDAGSVGHYSTPSYCARFPPVGATQPPVGAPVLTFGEATGLDVEPEWSAGVAAQSGEQLLQLPSGDTIKLRVRVHPHSSLLELQEVAQNDISASDIRRRLQGTFSSQESFFKPKAGSDLTIVDGFAEMTDVWSQSRAGVYNPRTINCDDILFDESNQKTIGTDNAISTQVQLDKVIVSEPPIAEALSQDFKTAPKPSEPEQNKEDANLPTEKQTVESEPAIEPKPTAVPESTVEASSNVLVFRGSPSMQSGQVHILEAKAKSEEKIAGRLSNPMSAPDRGLPTCSFLDVVDSEWASNDARLLTERLRCVIGVIAIEMGVTSETSPLFALHVDRAAVLIQHDSKGTKTVLSIADVQMDNLQFSSGQFDFGVVASTRAAPLAREAPPPIWSAFAARAAFSTRHATARLLLRLRHDSWRVVDDTFNELTEVELSVGPLALYVEDSYVAALTQLARAAQPAATPPAPAALAMADTRALQCPLRLRLLNVHPLDLTLTLHTAVRMYIALDQSPLRLSAFQLRDMMTSAERLTHALTVHYLSAAILGAGWVVGGLELLGAPGALAARVGGATGGVRGVATATAAALLRSLSAWAGSLARNLDLLAGDEEHARRAAAARRRAPHSLVEGLAAGITNFAINILGAVGGLAHHPLVGVAVGESTSGAAALRRCLLGALAKPLSATADLVAFAGTGLLHQTGWDPVPQPRAAVEASEASAGAGASWRRDSVRWAFRLVELTALAGFDVLLDGAPLRLLLSHKYLVVADADSERIVEMIDLRFCSLGPYQGVIIELIVAQSQPKQKESEAKAVDEDEEYQVNAAAMARVARYTGADGAAPAAGEARVLSLLPPPRHAAALHAALCAAVHNNADTHHHLL